MESRALRPLAGVDVLRDATLIPLASTTLDMVAVTFRFVLAFVFLAASLPKLLAPREFERAVRNYSLLPSGLVPVVAAWLPRLELVCAAALLVGILVRPMAVTLGVLLVCFAGAIAVNLARGRRFDCGCQANVAPRQIGWGLVAVDLMLAAMAAIVASVPVSVLSLDSGAFGATDSLGAGEAVALAMLAGATVVASHLVSAALTLQSSIRSIGWSRP